MNAVQNYFQRLSHGFSSWWNRFWFEPSDPATVCVLRILAGLLGLYYLVSHTADLTRWFGPHGLLPAGVVRQPELLGPTLLDGAPLQQASFHVSYLSWIADPTLLLAVHFLGILVLLALTVGLFSRLANVLSVVVVLSYVHRAPMITGQLEPLLTMLLVYLCVAPTGACLSLDQFLAARRSARQRPRPAEPRWDVTVSQRLIQVHLAGLYLVMGLTKLAGDTWWGGDAVWWLIAHTESRLIDLSFLYAAPLAINAWTHLIVLFELAFPLLIWNRLARPLLLIWAVVMWLSLSLITGLVPFCLSMLLANLAFVEPATMRRLAGLPAADTKQVLAEHVGAS